MTIQQLNCSDPESLRVPLAECCGARRWVNEILAARPFHDPPALFSAAESVWWALESSDWLEAFSTHPRIGEKKLSAWSSQEQSGLNSATGRILEQLAVGNREYEGRFGWIFLICATGRPATDMLQALQERLCNPPEQELRIAAAEQAKITRFRLSRLLNL
jgi:2-oxo-4-hydroxy-4-carboxy-5-ureidoimidazoline decarboxylase